jgi:hypothetical protein
MPEESIRCCIDRVLPDELIIPAAERAVGENASNVPVFRPGFGIAPPSRIEMAAVTGKLWKKGRTLGVTFMDGHPSVHSKVEDAARQWCEYANIKFTFGPQAGAEIRISFQHRGSWSYIGTDALFIAQAEPTMNFGWLTPNSSPGEYNRVVVHEFGHALGCIHEHQNPAGNIPWDKDAVYAYYAGPPNNWSRAKVDQNLFARYSRNITQFSAFDAKSIMLYPIPNEHTVGDFEVGLNSELSAVDKGFIGSLYAFETRPVAELCVDAPAIEASIGKHGEEDLFSLEITRSGTYKIETEGKTDVVMVLLGPDNETDVIAEDDDSGRNFNARIKVGLEPGRYYVRIRHYRPTGTGKYKISVQSAS